MANDFEEVGSSNEEKLKERRISSGQENVKRSTRKREIPDKLQVLIQISWIFMMDDHRKVF